MNNASIGGEFWFDHYDYSSTKSNSFGGLLVLRYYLGKSNIKPFAFFKVGAFYTKSGSSTGYNTNRFYPGAGLAVFLNTNVAVEGTLGYQFGKNEMQTKYDNIIFKLGLQVYLRMFGE